MRVNRFRRLLICLMAASIVTLVMVGVLAGCAKTSVKEEGKGEETEGEVVNGGEETTGYGGIAFIRDDNIYTAKADGSDERKLTSSAAAYGDLAFSPSGSKLAATKVEGDAFPQLVVVDAESGVVTDLSWTNPDYSAAWRAAGVEPWFGGISWAGENILYCTGMKNTSNQIILQVLRYDLSAKGITVIEGDAQNPSISPDGKTLAYIRKPSDWAEAQGGPWETGDYGDLIIRDLESGNTRMLNFNVFSAVFSSQGDRLAVTVFDEPDKALAVVDLKGERLYTIKVTGPAGIIEHPSFSPQGDKLIVCRGWRDDPGEPYTYEIFIVPTDENNAPESVLGKGTDPAWSSSQ